MSIATGRGKTLDRKWELREQALGLGLTARELDLSSSF